MTRPSTAKKAATKKATAKAAAKPKTKPAAAPDLTPPKKQPPSNVYEEDYDAEGWEFDNSHWFQLRGVWFATKALTLTEEEQLIADINSDEGSLSEGDFFKRTIADDQYDELMALINTPQGPDNPAGPVRSRTRKRLILDLISVIQGMSDPKPRGF